MLPLVSSILKREVAFPSETSVIFYQTTRRYIPDDRTFHRQRRNVLQYYKILLFFSESYKICVAEAAVWVITVQPQGTYIRKEFSSSFKS
jgi:hypothetical protein